MLLWLLFLILATSCFPNHPQIDNSQIWAERERFQDAQMITASANDVFAAVTVVSVYDGDTFTINLPDTIPDVFGRGLSVRIRHIDTAELKSSNKCERDVAIQAKNVTTQLLKSAEQIYLEDVGRDKYFRIDAVVLADGVSVGQVLLDRNLAVSYDGETKKSVDWCKMQKNKMKGR